VALFSTPSSSSSSSSPLPPSSAAVRWFVDGNNGLVDPANVNFMFNTHTDLVDGIITCCGQGHVADDGTVGASWGKSATPPPDHEAV
jgi:hypothetical protein